MKQNLLSDMASLKQLFICQHYTIISTLLSCRRQILNHSLLRTKRIIESFSSFSENIRNIGSRRMEYPKDIEILYKSANYLVIDKPYDVKINSNEERDTVTVETMLADKYPELVDTTLANKFRFAHRLDHATSGVLVLSLNKKAAAKVQKSFQKRCVTKHYLALVHGKIQKQEVSIDVQIGRDTRESEIHKMSISGTPGCLNPRHSETHLITLEHGLYNGSPASKVLLIPHTGRTHQLRVHCNYIGHRIIGDYIYSDRQDTEPHRMMLHAYHLCVNKKVRDEFLHITSFDPFVPEKDSLWNPLQVLVTYEQYTSQRLEASEEGVACSQPYY